MATYYVDYSGSAGTGDGSSYANRASKVQNCSAIGGLTLAAGTDEIRVKGNPITSLGTAKILNQNRPFQQYYNLVHWYSISGKINYSTTTGETYIDVGAMSHYGWVTGDKIMIFTDPYATANSQPSLVGIWEITTSGTDYTSNFKIKLDGYTANSNGTNSSGSGSVAWLPGNDAIKLNTTGLTKSIASRDADRSAWTAASGVTTSIENTSNYGAWNSTTGDNNRFHASDKIVVSSSASVGKVAHFQLPSTLDLSDYEQISFLCKASSPTSLSTKDTIRLCSDTAGNTTVHSIPIDLRNGRYEYFHTVVKDFGTALGSSIQSIALYKESSSNNQTYYFENFIACKDSSDDNAITHNSCIGLNDNTTNNKPVWYDIDFIWDDFVVVCSGAPRRNGRWSYYGSHGVYWSQTGASVNIYKCEPFLVHNTQNTAYFDAISFSDPTYTTLGTFVPIAGGWNDTDMTTTSGGNGYATIAKGNFSSRGWNFSSRSNWHIKDLYWHQWEYPVYASYSFRCHWENIGCTNSYFPMQHNQSYQVWGLGVAYDTAHQEYGQLYINQHRDSPKANYYFNLLNNGKNTNTYSYLKYQNLTANERPDYLMTHYREDGYAYYGGQPFEYNYIECDTWFNNNAIAYSSNGLMKANYGTLKIGTYNSSNGNYLYVRDYNLSIDNCNYTRTHHPTNSAAYAQIWGTSLSGTGIKLTSGSFYAGGGTCPNDVDILSDDVARMDGVTFSGPSAGFLYNFSNPGGGQLQVKDMNGVSGNDKTFRQSHTFTNDTSIRKTASGTSLKAQVSQSSSFGNPNLKLGSVLVAASSQVTISLWCYVPSGEEVKLIIPGVPWLGVTRQEASHKGSTAANTWTQISTSFTPSAAGQIDVEVWFSKNTVNNVMYIDDMGVSQS